MLLAHIDVVEAKREDWTTDPFLLTDKAGYFYGPGMSDDKAQAAVRIANLIRYKREGFKRERDLIMGTPQTKRATDLTMGSIGLLKHRRELINAEYALNEPSTLLKHARVMHALETRRKESFSERA